MTLHVSSFAQGIAGGGLGVLGGMGPLAALDQLAADGQPFFSIGGDWIYHENKGSRSRRTVHLATAQIFKIDASLPTMA